MNQPYVSTPVSSPLKGEITVPGDKSISHRALLLSSQMLGTTIITGLLEGEDVLRTADALRLLGVTINKNNDQWHVHGVGIGGLQEPNNVLDMGNSGTGARLLMGLLAPYPFSSIFSGDRSLSKRPMERVITPLSQMGASFTARAGGRLPLAMAGTANPLPITYILPVASAQVKSAILLAGLNTPGTTTVIEPHATRDHTENMLEHFGIPVERTQAENGLAITITGQPTLTYQDRELIVPADPSSTAFPVVAALLVEGSEVTLRNICMNPSRIGLYSTLREMGADITFTNEHVEAGEKVADMQVKYSQLHGVTVPAARAPSMIDEYPILAVAAAFAQGKTIMQGIQELRVKESDRAQAIVDGLLACGVQASIEGENLLVTGQKQPRGEAMVTTHYDHRIAMSFLIMGLATRKPILVDDASAIATSFPDFSKQMHMLGAQIKQDRRTEPRKPMVIAIDGPAASGKGTLARRIAEKFSLTYLDTGSLYRAVAYQLIKTNAATDDDIEAIRIAESITLQDISAPELRQENVGQLASKVSAIAGVRSALLQFQRNIINEGNGAVLDGRDIGTVVFPNATVKFFLTASLEARARRRHKQLQGQGIEVVYDSVLRDLTERDKRDETRTIAPLTAAKDAMTIDTSTMDINSVFEKVKRMVEERVKG